MKFNESWLREHVAVEADRDALCAALTAIGLEVEGVEPIGGELPGVIVAEIVEAVRHPEAERLQVCKVAVGGGEHVQIVCGAPNARAGLKAPLATVGTLLPGDLAIQAAKLRGVESFGMLCSAKELGIDPDASGLLELPADAPVGTALSAYLGLPDARIEIKLTPNRADCFSIRGIAFDVAAALGAQVRAFDAAPVAATASATLPVELNAGADAPRYCGRIIEGLNPNAVSPAWLTEKLKRCGLRPISPLVDISNLVMLELGQPMHAFDADRLSGPIGVRHGRAGESLKLLDEREAAVDAGFLVITDADRPVALAGVMGGFDTRVTDATTRVFLESAHFAPSAIIGRARKLGLHTDASHRFERGVDPELPRVALEYATKLVLDSLGGSAGPVVEALREADLPQRAPVSLRRERLARVLGQRIDDAEVARIFVALGMRVETLHATDADSDDAAAGANGAGWRITPPPRRFDIAIEEDLIEEVARIHGYNAVPAALPAGEIPLADHTETKQPEAFLRRQLAARGFHEAINFAFVDAALLQRWSLDDHAVALLNPLASDLGTMRTGLLPGLVEAIRRNLARQQTRVRLFEIGRVFHAPATAGAAPIETRRIAFAATGPAKAEQWGVAARPVDFHDLKGDLEALAGPAAARLVFEAASGTPWLHPGRSATVSLDGEALGFVGHLHPALAKALDLDGEVVVAELELGLLEARAVPKAGELSRFPSVRRDLAVLVVEDLPWARLEASLKAALGPLLREVRLFDRYVGKGLETGVKSLAMGLILQDVSRTLTDRDAEAAVQAALAALERDCGARLR
ncbi:phenylalanine--tRNA ligase subunit beta [Silanimonas sp.]|uniref:phenylalanine--tRNA ligase subunit beta n=1 Tax=Silanimonas sp. TaxID=1929290 RepID=UPI001BBEE8F2|nr:phenylalanine--tRNA ligase subunit beta [Silanimonas sp.]MBS3897028.1 phenylalanine--tRNA ligase subunit beta [Silanimonas sp.]